MVADAWLACGGRVVAIVDDHPGGRSLLSLNVLHPQAIKRGIDDAMVIAIGDNRVRKRVAKSTEGPFGTIIHPRAIVSKFSHIGEGTVVMAGVVVNADSRVGRHCILNTACSLDHDCVIGDFVHLAPNTSVCGGVNIGEGTLIGAGATVLPNISIGRWVVVGAGAVVTESLPDHAVAVGIPARVVRYDEFNQ